MLAPMTSHVIVNKTNPNVMCCGCLITWATARHFHAVKHQARPKISVVFEMAPQICLSAGDFPCMGAQGSQETSGFVNNGFFEMNRDTNTFPVVTPVRKHHDGRSTPVEINATLSWGDTVNTRGNQWTVPVVINRRRRRRRRNR